MKMFGNPQKIGLADSAVTIDMYETTDTEEEL